jgi:PTS system nitrogen regulatory IIA component
LSIDVHNGAAMRLTVRDAAGLLAVSEKTIYRWIKQGSIPVYRLNDQYRFNRAELLEWATARRIPVAPEIFHEAEGETASLPRLHEALAAGGVFYRIGGDDKPAVLRAVVETLRLPEEVDREFLLKILLAREALGATAIGGGLAVPHPRNPVVLHLNRPMICLCFLDHPVAFGALDGEPVRVLFTLLSPTVRAHLHMLARLSFALADERFRAAIATEASRGEILEAAAGVDEAIEASSGGARPAAPGAALGG